MYLREALAASSMTQSELARQLGVNRAIVSRWATGRACPSPDVLDRLRALLGAGLEMETRNVGRPSSPREVAFVRVRRTSRHLDARKVDILTSSGRVLASGTESGNLGDVLPILREQLERRGALAGGAQLLDWNDR